MRELSLFTGAGGGVLGTKLLGWETVGYVEWDEYCQRILRQRIEDGAFDEAPIFGDIRAFVGEGFAGAYKGMVDVITAGFPCQPFSVAGKKQGEQDERNMWPATWDCINAIRPPYILLENVTNILTNEYARTIYRNLAESGYDARWRCLSAAELGAPHLRDRLWIFGFDTNRVHADRSGEPRGAHKDTAKRPPPKAEQAGNGWEPELGAVDAAQRISTYPDALRILHGMDSRMDRYKAAGNGQVPQVVAKAWRLLTHEG